jgi:hypothetical protein
MTPYTRAAAIATVGLVALWRVSTIIPRDSTDPPNERSGLILRIDHMTGCHYIGTPFGGITPRLDSDGQHICTGETP